MRHLKILFLLVLFLGGVALTPAGVAANSLVWQAASNSVSADLRGEALWPLLEDIAHQTGWHIFVEPGLDVGGSSKGDICADSKGDRFRASIFRGFPARC